MRIIDYLNSCQLFPLMGIAGLEDGIATQLDTILMLRNGRKTCGSLIENYGDDPTKFSEETQTTIAKAVYMLNKHKWDSLIAFAAENIKPWIESQTKTTTEYGQVIDTANSGEDSYNQKQTIAGFDSTDLVDDNGESRKTTYGHGVKDTHSGTDTETTESRSKQAERLVDYTMQFWDKYGITKTIITDTVRTIALPLYESEE